jgi:squalene synthase HpnC
VTRLSLAAAREYCRQFTRRHSENFSVATLFLPRRLLPHFYAVYAYCRFADDLGDNPAGAKPTALRGHDEFGMPMQSHGHGTPLELLNWWRNEILNTFAGEPRHPIMIALAETIHRFGLPKEPFLDLLSAFEQDQTVKRYATYEQLVDYCRRSANPVGRILLCLFESFDERRAALSDRICTALQLTNFWQDVARDYATGRVYLPQEDMDRFGYTGADLQANRCTPAFVELMRFEVDRARAQFEAGLPLVDLVPRAVRLDVELFARGGLAILRKIERQGYNVWQRRPRLSRLEKAALIASALGRNWRQGMRFSAARAVR